MIKRKLLPVLFSMLAFGCTRPPEKEATQPARTKDAAILTVQKPTSMGGLVVNLLTLEDSRCPKDVTCIWYGHAVATLHLQDARGRTLRQQLYLGTSLPTPNNRGFREADTVVVQLGNKPYRLILSDVQPYPVSNSPSPNEKKAMVSVSAL